MLVSVSFQFVGFLLTYLLHTTHAAKLGSRAGLGITLIQYGFSMRSRADEWAGDEEGWGWQAGSGEPRPTFATAAEAEEYYRQLNDTATPTIPETPVPVPMDGAFMGDATTEWLSFFLMTVGESCLSSLYLITVLNKISRMVHPAHFLAQLLAGQALGTRYPCVSTRTGLPAITINFRPIIDSWQHHY